MLGYGGLISSRNSNEPADLVTGRLDLLHELKERYPALPIFGFNLITRVSNANDAIEERDYWSRFGTRLYRLSQLLEQQALGRPVDGQLDRLPAEIPEP